MDNVVLEVQDVVITPEMLFDFSSEMVEDTEEASDGKES